VTAWRSNIPRIVARSEKNLAAVVRKAAFSVEAHAKLLAPVDTGLLRKLTQAMQEGPVTWIVAVGAEYGVYVEFGTSRAPAQPFLTPAFEQVVSEFGGELKKVID
jgi:HK97 gp10 family phage protein